MNRLGQWFRRLLAPHIGIVPPIVVVDARPVEVSLEQAALEQLERTLGALPPGYGERGSVITNGRFGHTTLRIEVEIVDPLPALHDQRQLGAAALLREAIGFYLKRCRPGQFVEVKRAICDVQVRIFVGWAMVE